jgi:hypothetical protein
MAIRNVVTYESLRAFYLNQVIGPKGAPKHDFIIDMHTSTSNCGVLTNRPNVWPSSVPGGSMDGQVRRRVAGRVIADCDGAVTSSCKCRWADSPMSNQAHRPRRRSS